MDGEDYRTGSADSENGSENSYVQVSSEDVQSQPPMPTLGEDAAESSSVPEEREATSEVPPLDEEEDLYGSGEDSTEQPSTEKPDPFTSDPMFIDSPPEEKEEEPVVETTPTFIKTAPPISTSAGVEEVQPVPSAPPKETSKTSSFQATGYLSFLNFLHPLILDIVYWRDVKLSAVVLGMDLVVLLTLTLNTFIHTMVLLLLSFLVVSLVYIITRIAIDTFYNKEAKNPFSDYLNRKITLPEEKILGWTHIAVEKLDRYFNTLVRLLLFDNIKASLKFGFMLWGLSFVTNCFTLLLALALMVVVLFSVPPVYQKFQRRIDSRVDDAVKKGTALFNHVRENIPFYSKKTKVE